MNRTNSVEPVFSQPLQVTYHQLLQNKSKIEDELYQTQRQLRRKEGEYQKKIAVYEQKIDQMQEQIDDFREREENMKAMYEKILNALNTQADKQMLPNIDLERVQEILIQIQKSHQNSPTHSEKSLNSSFRRGGRNRHEQEFNKEKEKYQSQIDSLEISITNLTDSNIKLKNKVNQKDRENQTLLNEIEGLKRSLEITKKEVELVKQSNQNEIDVIVRDTESKVKSELCQQIDNYQSQFMTERAQLVTKIESLESQVKQDKTKHQQKQYQQERSFIKELSEVKQANEKYRKDIENLTKEKETLIKEKDLLFQQVKEQNQNMTKLKNSQNNSSQVQTEQVKKLKSRVRELEKELAIKSDELTKLNTKNSTNQRVQQQNTNQQFIERKNSSGPSVTQSLSNLSQIKNFNVGSKDQQVLVDIQTTMNKKGSKNNGGSKTNRHNNTQQQPNKAFPQQVTINIDNTQNLPAIVESTKNLKKNANPKTSRNSNGIAHSSLANPQTFMPRQDQQDKQRTHTPMQERHFVDLEDSRSLDASQILSSNHKKNMLDSSLNSGAKSNQNLHRYINTNEVRHFENMMSRSNSQSCYPDQNTRYQNPGQRSPKDQTQQINQQRQMSAVPIDRYYSESERVLLSSIEIEQVVRKMLQQVNFERYNTQNQGEHNPNSILKPSQFHNMQTPSQNVSFTQKKYLDQSQFNSSKYSSSQSKGYFTLDADFLIKLENSLKKLAKSNEKIKQIMKEKETFEQQCLKLKEKIKLLKEEKKNWLAERENLIQQNHKMECKLKQAQVILNLESEMQNQPSYLQNNNNNTGIYDVSHNSSQKTLIRHFGQRDISPGAQSNLTLNIIQEAVGNNDRYRNPPMSCRVNDSYDISLRLNPDNSYGALTRKPMFHNTLDRSLLDQSLLTIKRDIMNQNYQQNNQNLQTSQLSNQNTSQQLQNQSYQSKFLPQNANIQLFPPQPQLLNQKSSTSSTFRGKTPTLQINLSQSPNANEGYCIGITTQGNMQDTVNMPPAHDSNNGYCVSSSQERDEQSMFMNSMNLSKSTNNLVNRKPNMPVNQNHQQPPRQLFKYQSNRSPQNRVFQNYQNGQILSGQSTIQKQSEFNQSNSGLNDNSQLFQFQHTKTNLNMLNISSNTAVSNKNLNEKQMNISQNNNNNNINNQTQSNSFINQSNHITQDRNNIASQQQQQQLNNHAGLRRLNSNKAKDRYYSNKRGSQQVQSLGRVGAFIGDKSKYITHQTEVSAVYPIDGKGNQMLTFDEDEDYLIEEQQTLEDEQQNTMSVGRKNILNHRQAQQQNQQTNLTQTTTMDNNQQHMTTLNSQQQNSTIDNRNYIHNNNIHVEEEQDMMQQFYQQQQCYDAMFNQNLNIDNKIYVSRQINDDSCQQDNIADEEEEEEEEDANMIDTDENESVNCFGQMTTKTNKSDSTTFYNNSQQQNNKQHPSNRLSTCSIDNRQIRNQNLIDKHSNRQLSYQQLQQQDNNKCINRVINTTAIVPSDEKSSDEESVQYKILNNSNNFMMPFMHSRYANNSNSNNLDCNE